MSANLFYAQNMRKMMKRMHHKLEKDLILVGDNGNSLVETSLDVLASCSKYIENLAEKITVRPLVLPIFGASKAELALLVHYALFGKIEAALLKV